LIESEAMPRISICIPSYNHGRFLSQTIESVLSQPDTDIEVVLLDDGSTDETLDIAASVKDQRFRVTQNPERLGLGRNFNRCLDVAAGTYVKVLCDDDLLYPGALTQLANALDRFPQAPFATSGWHIVGDQGDVIETIRLRDDSVATESLVALREVAKSSWLFRNRIGGPSTVLLRRSALEGVRFNPECKQMLDWELWLQLMRRGPLVYVPRVLSAYRQHSATQSALQWERAQAASDLLDLSLEMEAWLPSLRGSITRFDLKRLQGLCSSKAFFAGLRSWVNRDGALARQNLALAIRAFKCLVAAK
jgi:glycosyltransferase involved in cell wall biosynthesis